MTLLTVEKVLESYSDLNPEELRGLVEEYERQTRECHDEILKLLSGRDILSLPQAEFKTISRYMAAKNYVARLAMGCKYLLTPST